MPSSREAYFSALKKGVEKDIVNFALQEVNGFDYSELSKHFDGEIKDVEEFNAAIDRYLAGEMIEYIFNKSYFLGLPLYVNKNVLIPRQETEQLVIRTKELIKEIFKVIQANDEKKIVKDKSILKKVSKIIGIK